MIKHAKIAFVCLALVGCGVPHNATSVIPAQISGNGTKNSGSGNAQGQTQAPTPTPASGPSGSPAADGTFNLGALKMLVPNNWQVLQDATDDVTRIVGIQVTDAYVTLYQKTGAGDLNIQEIFGANGATVVTPAASATYAGINFQTIVTQKDGIYTAGFTTTGKPDGYFGYATASTSAKATAGLQQFFATLK